MAFFTTNLSSLIIKSEDYSQVVGLIGGNGVKQDELLETPPFPILLSLLSSKNCIVFLKITVTLSLIDLKSIYTNAFVSDRTSKF